VQLNIPPRVKGQVHSAVPTATPATIVALSTDDQIKAARCREMALNLARKCRMEKKRPRPGIGSLMLHDLQKFLSDTYDKHGPSMPEGDDAASEHFVVLLHFVARLGDPSALQAAKARWCPWLAEAAFDAMIAKIERKPRRWRADSLAQEIGLNRVTRTRLGITTIGAIDFKKATRTKLRKKLNNADKRARRAAAGAKPHAASAARLKPWITLGISERTWFRRRANGSVGSETGTAAYYDVVTNDCQTTHSGASPEGESAADACAPSPDAGTASTARVDRLAALEIAFTKRDSAFAGRLGLHWIKTGKNPVDHFRLNALTSSIGRAAA
jgi:hypothetical protein